MKQDWKAAGRYGTVGLEIVLSVVVGFVGGSFLDRKLGTGGWLTALGVIYGVAAAARALYRAARRATREAEELDRREHAVRKDYQDDEPPT